MAQSDEITAENACEYKYRSVPLITANDQTNVNEYDHCMFFIFCNNIEYFFFFTDMHGYVMLSLMSL